MLEQVETEWAFPDLCLRPKAVYINKSKVAARPNRPVGCAARALICPAISMNQKKDHTELITNSIVIVSVLILLGLAIVYGLWPREISRFIRSLLE